MPIKVYASILDEKARRQLVDLAESGIAEEFVAAMPDVHYGLGATIGSVFASSWAVCPNAVGVDIGCGMAAIPFPSLHMSQVSQELRWKIHSRIKERIPSGMNIHESAQYAPVLDDMRRTAWLSTQINSRVTRSIGTLGGGNHFIEIVHDAEGFVWAMLHSGSRNIGKLTADRYNEVAKTYMEKNGIVMKSRDLNYLTVESEEGQNYLTDMNWCQQFALANRRAMQKGLIPGSMAHGSWLVEGKGNWESWYSCSHGSGRTKSRTACFNDISQTDFVSVMQGIVAETVPELRDEAPQAYKDLSQVMEDQSDLVEPKIRLQPIINVKGWDPKNGKKVGPGKIVSKLPVTVTYADAAMLRFLMIETHVSEHNKKPVVSWTDIKTWKMRVTESMIGETRELWAKTEPESGEKHLVLGRISDVHEESIEICFELIRRSQRVSQ